MFANQSAITDADYDNWVQQNFPSASVEVWSYISEELYPPKYDGSQPYNSPLERLTLTTQEYLIACNTVDMGRAYGNQTYNSIFGIDPSVHAQDLGYTFYNGESGYADERTAITWQSYIVQFALTGKPNVPGLTLFPVYTARSQVLKFFSGGIVRQISEPAANARCEWWLKGLYAPTPPLLALEVW